jgi:hypothetical protein
MNNNIIMEPLGVDFVIGPSKMTKKDFQEISAYIKKHKKENLKSLITTNKKNKSKK